MRCKPGDLAFIIRADNPENLGRIVRVLEPYPGFPGAWWTEMQGRPGVICGQPAPQGAIWDEYLRPIRPDKESTPTHKELTA